MVVGGSLRQPEIVVNEVVEILGDQERLCFHAAAEMKPDAAERWIERMRARALGSQTPGRTPAKESGGLLTSVSRLELMSNSKNKNDVFGREPTVLRDITVAAARENEFPSTFFGSPP